VREKEKYLVVRHFDVLWWN